MKDRLIVKSNQLIEARYDLNLNEQKIILYAASKLDRNKSTFNFIEFDIKDFTDLLDSKGKRYEELREVIRGLRQKEIIIHTNEKEYITGWLSGVTFFKNTGKVKLRFDDDLIPYLLQLNKKFTRYQLKNVLYLRSKYGIRIYELLKQYETIGSRTFELDKLKQILFIDDQYKRIYDFEKYVLTPAINEINEYTDINVIHTKNKKGRAIIGYTFKVEPKNTEEKIYNDYLNDYYDIKEMMEKMGIEDETLNSTQVMNLYERAIEKTQYEYDPFEYVNINYLYVKEKGTYRNIYNYLMEALERDMGSACSIMRIKYKQK